jgi:hypothetical protein
MAYETVTCEVRWAVTVEHLDASGTFSVAKEKFACESNEKALDLLAGMDIRDGPYGLRGPFCRAKIKRVLVEV